MIIHCLEREEKARKTLSPVDIIDTDNDNGIFSVRGKLGYTYTVDFGNQTGKPSCTCQDWTRKISHVNTFFLYLSIREGGVGALSHKAT